MLLWAQELRRSGPRSQCGRLSHTLQLRLQLIDLAISSSQRLLCRAHRSHCPLMCLPEVRELCLLLSQIPIQGFNEAIQISTAPP